MDKSAKLEMELTMLSDLTPRQQTILGLVIREYVAEMHPISSKMLLEQYHLNVSSATVRNEMACLEELGYLCQPHTSAGRLPTDMGYRFFVERLLGETRLPVAERRTIAHQFHQARLNLNQWMRLAATTLAQTACNASLITAPQAAEAHFKHIELISTQGRLVLLILVLQDGNVRQQMLSLAEPFTQEELSQAADRLNQACAGLSAGEIRTRVKDLPTFESEICDLMLEMLEDTDSHIAGEIYRGGLSEMLSQPEFIDTEISQGPLRLLEEPSFLDSFLSETLSPAVGGVQVIIGGEGRWEELSSCSMVLARYGVPGFATGALGVLGPTRMAYGRAISAVSYVAELMSELIYEMYTE
jgi:heat-inducible transcriptional repressor